MSKEGESGRKKLDVVTRVLSVALAAVQAYGIIVAYDDIDKTAKFIIDNIITPKLNEKA